MRLMMVSPAVPFLPCRDGFRVIGANLIRELHRRHEIDLIAGTDGSESAEEIQWANQYCSNVEVVRLAPARGLADRMNRAAGACDPALAAAVVRRIAEARPDVMHLEGPSTAALGLIAPAGVVTLLSAHDSLPLRYRQFAHNADRFRSRVAYTALSMLTRVGERRFYRGVNCVIVTSEPDLDDLARRTPRERLRVIPNGVDLAYLEYRPTPVGNRVVFTGNMSWPPNEDAAEYFATECWNTVRGHFPDAEFWIVGADPSDRVRALGQIDGVNVSGTVPDIREWIWNAAVYVSPLRFGMGIKNKIIEAMALGAPIVATPASLSGTPLAHRAHLLVAEDARALASAVVELLGNRELAKSLSLAARGEAEQKYSWSKVAEQFERAYAECDPRHRG